MQRSIVKLSDLENAKGGDRIDFLSKPTSYAGGHRVVSNKGPIFQKDKDKPKPLLDISQSSAKEKTTLNLPDLVTSPIIKNQVQSSKMSSTKRNNSVTVHSMTNTSQHADLANMALAKSVLDGTGNPT